MNSIIKFKVLMIVLAGLTLSINSASAFKETKSSYSDGYNKGYDDAIGGFSFFCGDRHTKTYCSGYEQGYRAGISSIHVSNNDYARSNNNNNNVKTSTDIDNEAAGKQQAGQHIGDVNIKGNNNNVEISQSQAQSQKQHTPSSVDDPRINDPNDCVYHNCVFRDNPDDKTAIENALIPNNKWQSDAKADANSSNNSN